VIAALVRWLPLSLAIHAAAFAATALLPREPALAPLFVDLTLDAHVSEPLPAGGRRAGDGRTARQPARGTTRAPGDGVSRAPAASPPAASPPSAAPPPASSPVAIPPVPTPPVVPPPVAASTPESSVVSSPPVSPPAAAPSEAAALVVAPPNPSSLPMPGDATGESPREPAWSGSGAGGAALGTASAGGGEIAGSREAGATTAGGAGDGRASGTGDGTLALAIPGDGGGVYGAYLALLRRRVQQSVTYPESARRRSAVGTVHLEITLEESGRITEVTLVRSSSHSMLDEAALEGVRALRRVPFPSDVRPRPLRVRLPVVFELR
jgi:periplasmic protein TonB